MTVDLAGVCSGPGPCDTTPFGAGKNWVNSVGGLPLYIRAIAKALQRSGHSESSAIATAVATVKRWAAGGGGVSAETRARAAAAVAEWERKKAQSHALTAAPGTVVDLADTSHVYHWRHGWIPITPHAALQKAHGSHAGAARILHGNGQHEDARSMLRAGVAHHEALGHVKTAARYRQALASTPGGEKARLQIRPGSYQGSTGHHIVGQDTRGRRVQVFASGDRSQAEKAAENIRAGRSAFDVAAQPKAPEVPSARTQGISIEHTGDGTLVHGTTRSDGSGTVLKQHGFRWSSNLGAWYLPRNQHFSTRGVKVDNAERDLKAAGHDVTVTREAARNTSAAERETAARARASDRAGRMDAKAERAATQADVQFGRAKQIGDMIPLGQPILAGHHSQRRHERDISRIGSAMDKGVAAHRESKAATAAADRARATAAGDSPLLRQRRIDRNEAEIRKIDKSLAQHEIAVKKPEAAARFGIHPSSDAHLAQLRASRAELADQVAHDKAQIAASGHKAVTAADIKAGDTIHYRGRTHVVKKVNKTTVSVPTGYSWDDKVPINQITRVVKAGASLTATPTATVDLADSVFATTDGPSLTVGAGQHRYHHGWVRIDAAAPSAVERATRAVATDGHALLHGAGMVPAAQKVIERAKGAGHRVSVRRIDVAGTPHLHIAKTDGANLTAADAATVDLAWNEAAHPRAPKGAAGGGRFAGKNASSSAPPSNMASNVRDFQRRNKLPVTGVVDTATAAKIRAELAAKGGAGGGKRTVKAKAAKAARAATAAQKQTVATHVATVNAMTPTQRATARAQVPIPPTGYVWAPDNTLRRFHG